MSVFYTWVCEGPGCDTQQRTDEPEPPYVRSGWLSVRESTEIHYFCSQMCMLKAGAADWRPIEEHL